MTTDPRLAVAEPLLEEAAGRKARYSGRALTSLALLVGLSLAVLLASEPVARRGAAQIAAAQHRASNLVEVEEVKDDNATKAGEPDAKGPPPPGNGGKTDTYVWTQLLPSVEVFVELRPGLKSKDIICEIKTDHLKVGIKGEPLLIDGKFHKKVRPADCMWTLTDGENGKTIVLNLDKDDQMDWWECLIEGDPKINTKDIVPGESKLSELDGEMRQTVEKMMYDQRMKEMGKPTSDQKKQWEALEKIKAQNPEMDFSKAKIDFGGGGGFNFPGGRPPPGR